MAKKQGKASFKSALLTRTELEWLSGRTENISKSFEYKMKSIIRKKMQFFNEIELPLILRCGLFLSANELPSSSARYYGPLEEKTYAGPNEEFPMNDNSRLGKAKVLGPNPIQGLPLFRNGVRIVTPLQLAVTSMSLEKKPLSATNRNSTFANALTLCFMLNLSLLS